MQWNFELNSENLLFDIEKNKNMSTKKYGSIEVILRLLDDFSLNPFLIVMDWT